MAQKGSSDVPDPARQCLGLLQAQEEEEAEQAKSSQTPKHAAKPSKATRKRAQKQARSKDAAASLPTAADTEDAKGSTIRGAAVSAEVQASADIVEQPYDFMRCTLSKVHV